MFCKNCGADLAEGAVFCGNCGMRVETEEPEVNTEAPAEPNTEFTPEPKAEPAFENNEIHHVSQQPQQNTYQSYQQNVQAPQYNYVNMNNNAGADINPTLWIILSAIEIITCCSLIPGVIGLIFAIMASSKKTAGNFDEARSNVKVAKIAVLVGLGLFVISIIGSIATGVLASIAEGLNY